MSRFLTVDDYGIRSRMISLGRGSCFLFLMLAFLSLIGCKRESLADSATCKGDVLFGLPDETTGLTSAECQPRCTCGGKVWEAPVHTEQEIDALLTWNLLNPPDHLTSNPYMAAVPPEPNPDEVCAVMTDGSGAGDYSLQSFASIAEAEGAGGQVTHSGACGLCSSLADLAVYMRVSDLTTPVRACGLKGGTMEVHLACLAALGFTEPCAEIWYYNTINTRDNCFSECIKALDDPWNLPDGRLNPCLQCDEDKSGPVFKAVAGRTRRNTGVPSAICRPCGETLPLDHDYY
jgi:hypothetical protein